MAVPIGSGYSCKGNKIILQGKTITDYKERKQNFAAAIKNTKGTISSLQKRKPQTKEIKKSIASYKKLLVQLQTVQTGMALCAANAAPALVFKQLNGQFSGHYSGLLSGFYPIQGNWQVNISEFNKETVVRIAFDDTFSSVIGVPGAASFEFSFDPKTIPMGGTTTIVHPTVGTIYVGMSDEFDLSIYIDNVYGIGLSPNFSLAFDKKYKNVVGKLNILGAFYSIFDADLVLGRD